MFPMHGGFMGRGGGGPITSGLITLEFDDIVNAPVADPTDVSDWNTLFNLPALGTEFTSVSVTGDIVELFGGANIELKNVVFGSSFDQTNLIQFIDTDCVTSMTVIGSQFQQQLNLKNVTMPVCTNIANFALARTQSLSTAIFPLATSLGNGGINLSSGQPDALTSISLPEVTTMTGIAQFENRISLTTSSLPKATTIAERCFRDCVAHTSTTITAATSIGNSSFRANPITTISAPNCITIFANAFFNCGQLSSGNFPLVTTIESSAFNNTPLYAAPSFPELLTMGSTAFIISANNATMTSFSAPKCTTLNGIQNFRRRTGLTSINLAACTQLGATTGSDNIFLGISGNTITFTLPVGTRTDGDAVALAAANTVTFLP